MLKDSIDCVGALGRCEGSNMVVENNTYYTPHGNATINCEFRHEVSLPDVAKKYGIEKGSTVAPIPPSKTIVQWAYTMLLA